MLGLTRALVKLGTMTHPVKRALRDTVIPFASRISAVQRRAVRRMTHRHVNYRRSRLTQPGPPWAGLRPGDRIGDIDVVGEDGRSRLYEVLRCGRHVMLLSGIDTAHALERAEIQAYGRFFETVVAGPFGERRHRRRPRPAVLLIRPDGYLAARGSLDGLPTLLAYLREMFSASAVGCFDSLRAMQGSKYS